MSMKFCALVLLTLATISLQSNNDNFVVVSTTTTERTENTNNLDEVQTKLATLEAQIAKLQKTLQDKTNPETNTLTKHVPTNCKEIQKQGHNTSNIYYIQPRFSSEAFPVVCDMKTRGGGWTYILNRFDGSEAFYVKWDSYKQGFGNLGGEFWLGLEKIHLLTGYEFNELLVEIVDWDNKQVDAHYNTFTVGNEKEGYVLKILEGYSGTAGDSFKNEVGMRFTTRDKDQDVWNEGNCASFSEAAWWYRSCKWSHPTGKYFKDSRTGKDYLKGIYWVGYRGNTYSHKQIRMMVRPREQSKAELFPKEKFL
ncbi:hypothetical protein Zmor_008305 [Zophobas morio]|uniref:Fibrinogen C-terminal domain-containing protein n=1 Tax=Zophobas morio TaxID=2755281 RepID=A0AA38IV82_9CUCU|nr:hypothetical protein Zmor_008305 [Zophobas morio]